MTYRVFCASVASVFGAEEDFATESNIAIFDIVADIIAHSAFNSLVMCNWQVCAVFNSLLVTTAKHTRTLAVLADLIDDYA